MIIRFEWEARATIGRVHIKVIKFSPDDEENVCAGGRALFLLLLLSCLAASCEQIKIFFAEGITKQFIDYLIT